MYQYVGKFNHTNGRYAVNELFTVTFPKAISLGGTVVVTFQWTKRADGKEKVNDVTVGTITKANIHSDGKTVIDFVGGEHYKYEDCLPSGYHCIIF
jgi:hypothetical protein